MSYMHYRTSYIQRSLWLLCCMAALSPRSIVSAVSKRTLWRRELEKICQMMPTSVCHLIVDYIFAFHDELPSAFSEPSQAAVVAMLGVAYKEAGFPTRTYTAPPKGECALWLTFQDGFEADENDQKCYAQYTRHVQMRSKRPLYDHDVEAYGAGVALLHQLLDSLQSAMRLRKFASSPSTLHLYSGASIEYIDAIQLRDYSEELYKKADLCAYAFQAWGPVISSDIIFDEATAPLLLILTASRSLNERGPAYRSYVGDTAIPYDFVAAAAQTTSHNMQQGGPEYFLLTPIEPRACAKFSVWKKNGGFECVGVTAPATSAFSKKNVPPVMFDNKPLFVSAMCYKKRLKSST